MDDSPRRSQVRVLQWSTTQRTCPVGCYAAASGNINTNNNNPREVEPLQAIAAGPGQAIVFTRLAVVSSSRPVDQSFDEGDRVACSRRSTCHR